MTKPDVITFQTGKRKNTVSINKTTHRILEQWEIVQEGDTCLIILEQLEIVQEGDTCLIPCARLDKCESAWTAWGPVDHRECGKTVSDGGFFMVIRAIKDDKGDNDREGEILRVENLYGRWIYCEE